MGLNLGRIKGPAVPRKRRAKVKEEKTVPKAKIYAATHHFLKQKKILNQDDIDIVVKRTKLMNLSRHGLLFEKKTSLMHFMCDAKSASAKVMIRSTCFTWEKGVIFAENRYKYTSIKFADNSVRDINSLIDQFGLRTSNSIEDLFENFRIAIETIDSWFGFKPNSA